jgi:phosphoglycolate phosphatase-like HAD superfamily hydrolase
MGWPEEELAAEINRFYDEVFPTLETLTRPRPAAIEMVEWAFAQGWEVAIATDPLFPRKAILHRLRWAGLAPEKYPFKLVSDFETFHFAKASVAYYPEFLAHMRWADTPLLMVGDSLERDVQPSQQAGLPVFWLKTNEQAAVPGLLQGNFADLKQLLERTDPASFTVNQSGPSALCAFLQATPSALHTLSRTISSEQWTHNPRPAEWSCLEVLCHLRDVDMEVNLPRLELFLKESNPIITAQETDQWAKARQYQQQDPAAALADFLAARKKLVARLASLPAADWQRPARHTILGPTSLRELVGFMVDHDQLHIHQAFEALN